HADCTIMPRSAGSHQAGNSSRNTSPTRIPRERPTQLTSSEGVKRVWIWSLLVTGCTWVLRPKRRKAPEKITRSWSLWNGLRPGSSLLSGLPRRSWLSRVCQFTGLSSSRERPLASTLMNHPASEPTSGAGVTVGRVDNSFDCSPSAIVGGGKWPTGLLGSCKCQLAGYSLQSSPSSSASWLRPDGTDGAADSHC